MNATKKMKRTVFVSVLIALALCFFITAISAAARTTKAFAAESNAAASPVFGKIETSLKGDTTLQKVFNLPKNADLEFTNQTAGIPKDNGADVTNAYRINLSSSKVAASKNVIEFKNPVQLADVEQSSGLTIRMYAHLSAVSPYFIKVGAGSSDNKGDFVLNCAYGIYFYGVGMTGAYTDTPVWLPADIAQDGWVDFKINAYDAARLAVHEQISGLAVGMLIESAADDQFYVGEPSAAKSYIYIKDISLDAPVSHAVKYGDIDLRLGLGSLTHFKANKRQVYANQPADIRDVAFKAPVDTLSNSALEADAKKDNGADVQQVYRLRMHNWETITSKHAILFDRPYSKEELLASGGLTLRVFADLTRDHSNYWTGGGGIALYGYGKGIDGVSNDYVDIPANITQMEWIDFNLTAAQAAKLAGSDGMLYGLQYGAKLAAAKDTDFYIGNHSVNKARFYIQSVSLDDPAYHAEKTMTYHMYDDVTETASFTYDVTECKIVPDREGYLFAGWYADEALTELYDFNAHHKTDQDVYAKWIELHADPGSFKGIYTDNSNVRITVSGDGVIGHRNVVANNYADRLGIDKDGKLQIIVGDDITTIDLSLLTKEALNTVTFYSNGVRVEQYDLSANETVTELKIYAPIGFKFVQWSVGSPDGAKYRFGQTISEDIDLYAKFVPDERDDGAYAAFAGKYYNPVDGTTIILGNDKKATVPGKSEKVDYLILSGGGFAFIGGDGYTIGEISALKLTLDGVDYLHLTSFTVTFSLGAGITYATATVDGGEFKAAKPEDPVKDGRRFVGWQTIEGDLYDFDSVVCRSITLYAKWEKAEASDVPVKEENGGKGCGSVISAGGLLIALTCLGAAFIIIKKGVRNEKN